MDKKFEHLKTQFNSTLAFEEYNQFKEEYYRFVDECNPHIKLPLIIDGNICRKINATELFSRYVLTLIIFYIQWKRHN